MAGRAGFDQRGAWLALALALAAAFVLLAALGLEPHLLKPEQATEGGLKEFINKVNSIKGPATLAMGSLSAVGVTMGGGLLAFGQQSGVRIMGMSAGAGGGVLIGNGLIA